LLQLKNSGIVASTRGAAGGYQLVRDPAQITLAEVMDVAEGQRSDVTSSSTAATNASQVLLDVWNEVRRVERSMLENTTLADLAERVQGATEQMYFI
jgi:Rrf2 family protein